MTVTISKEEYYVFRCAQDKLDCLECGGVDNWQGYSESLNPEEGETHFEFKNRLKAEIFE